MDLLNFLFMNIYYRIRDLCLAILGLCIIAVGGIFLGTFVLIAGFCYIVFGDLLYENNKVLSWNVFRHDHIR